MFENFVVLFGMPRSGTTIISRLIANHSRVQAIVEPFQSRRASNYSERNPLKLAGDFGLTQKEKSSLLVKETLTRKENIELVAQLLESAADANLRSAYIFVLRSPLEAFLSQTEATRTFWAKPTNFGEREASLRSFWKTFCRSMDCYLTFAMRFHRRFIVYDRFTMSPAEEIGRAMTLFGYPFEPSQMDVSTAKPDFGGDPKARRASPGIVSSDERSEGVARISEKFAGLPEFAAMKSMHEYIKEIRLEQPASSAIMANLAVITRRSST